MLPSDLKPEQFNGYPPEARKLASGYVATLQRLPLSFLPSLLREAIEYDFKFPAERRSIEKELANLNSLSTEQIKDWFQGFAQIRLSSQLEHSDWVNAPGQFVEQLSSYLWTTHQLDAFRIAALAYADHCGRLRRRNRLRRLVSESLLSARESRHTTNLCFANSVRMAHISAASSRRTV